MKASIIILATLINIFFIHPSVQTKLMYTNEWECIIEILFNEEIMKKLLEMNDSECTKDFDFATLIKNSINAKIKKPIDALKQSFINKLNDITNNIQKTAKNDLEDIILTKEDDQSDLNDKFKMFKLDISSTIENQNYGLIDKNLNDKHINNIFDYKIKIDDQKNDFVLEKENVVIKREESASSEVEDGLSDFGSFGLMDFDHTVLKEIKIEDAQGAKIKSVGEKKIFIDVKKDTSNEFVIEDDKIILEKKTSSEEEDEDLGSFGLPEIDTGKLVKNELEDAKTIKLKSVSKENIVINSPEKDLNDIVVNKEKVIIKKKNDTQKSSEEDFGIFGIPETNNNVLVENKLEDIKTIKLKSVSKDNIVINSPRKTKSNDIVIKKENIVIEKKTTTQELSSEEDFGINFDLPDIDNKVLVQDKLDDAKTIILKSVSDDKIVIRKNTTKTKSDIEEVDKLVIQKRKSKSKTVSENIIKPKIPSQSKTKSVINEEITTNILKKITKTNTNPTKTIEDPIMKKSKTNDIKIEDVSIKKIEIKTTVSEEDEDLGYFGLPDENNKTNEIIKLEDTVKPIIKSVSKDDIEIRKQSNKSASIESDEEKVIIKKLTTKTGSVKSNEKNIVINKQSTKTKSNLNTSVEENIVIKKLTTKSEKTKTKSTLNTSVEENIVIKKITTKSEKTKSTLNTSVEENIVIKKLSTKTATIKSKSSEKVVIIDKPEKSITPKSVEEKIVIKKKTISTIEDPIMKKSKTNDIKIEDISIKKIEIKTTVSEEDEDLGYFGLPDENNKTNEIIKLEDTVKPIIKSVSKDDIEINKQTNKTKSDMDDSKSVEDEIIKKSTTKSGPEEIFEEVPVVKPKTQNSNDVFVSDEKIVNIIKKTSSISVEEDVIFDLPIVNDKIGKIEKLDDIVEPVIKSVTDEVIEIRTKTPSKKTVTKSVSKTKSTKQETKSETKEEELDDPQKTKSQNPTKSKSTNISIEDPNKTTLTDTETKISKDDPIGPQSITSYSESKIKENIGITIYALQTSAQRLLSSDNRNKEEIIEEIEILFKLLPICLQNALLTCEPSTQKLKKRCKDSYNSPNLLCESEDNFKFRLHCSENEEFFNDACYTKCPAGFEDLKMFCKKGNYVKRYVGEGRRELGETMWGQLVVEDCKRYGEFYESIGSDYCRMVCPEGWKDHGMLCEKPVRFLNQKIFVFGKEDVGVVEE